MKNTKTIESKIKQSIKKGHLELINTLVEKGYQAYVVGGTVRDAILDKQNDDVDIATSATAKEVIEIFNDYTVIEVGIEHGTVAVVVNKEPVEITTFRQDGEYSDGRHPDSVTFTKNLKDDVMRRDFTINALAYNDKEGIVDLVEGMKDIENEVIKAVGSPHERFMEDPLRIMRGLRFASKLGFTIEQETEKAMFENKSLLKNISAERIQKEFNGLIKGKHAAKILVKYKDILSEAIPGIKQMFNFDQKNPHHIYDVWEHTANVVQNAKNDLAHKLAGVFHDSGKPATFKFDEEKQKGQFPKHAEESVKIADKALRDLRYSNKIRERVLDIIIDHDETLSTKAYKIKKNIYEKGVSRFYDMIEFKKADDSAKNPSKMAMYSNYEKIDKIAKEYLEGTPILSHKDVAITGQDVIELGYKGPEIKKTLDKVAFLVMGGHSEDREWQIEYLKKNKS